MRRTAPFEFRNGLYKANVPAYYDYGLDIHPPSVKAIII